LERAAQLGDAHAQAGLAAFMPLDWPASKMIIKRLPGIRPPLLTGTQMHKVSLAGFTISAVLVLTVISPKLRSGWASLPKTAIAKAR
jgi:hypothetical protein